MPPHCDSMDGPVVKAAMGALDERSVELVLPYVPEDAEEEVRAAFEKTLIGRETGGAAGEIATEWFCETVVRLHRAGEGAAFTGLKPAGLDHGPAVPRAEAAIDSEDPAEIAEVLTSALREQLESKFRQVMALKHSPHETVAEMREYVEAMLGFQVWSHRTYKCIAGPMEHGHAAAHPGSVHG